MATGSAGCRGLDGEEAKASLEGLASSGQRVEHHSILFRMF